MGKRQIKIVFDVDDVLWPLGKVVARELGIEPERYFHQFSVRDNEALSQAEREAVIAAYADASYFERIEFFAEIAEILRPCELGAVVKIKSNSFSERIAELKVQQLLAAIPGLREEDIQMSIIHYGQAHGKTIDSDTTIFVDDSPFNVSTSPAAINIMPDLGNWNRGDKAKEILGDKPVLYAQNLGEINELVLEQVRQLSR